MVDRRVAVKIDADPNPFVRGLTTASTAAKGFAHELESADGRMANLVQTGLALAPALVPIGAAAVPALAGLTLQLGLAAAAGGTALLAFHGIGDALKALDTYQLQPTAENFAKLKAELDKLGPAGQEFTLYLDQLKGHLQGVQDLAEQGLLPGVEDSINHLLGLLPQVDDVVFTISSTLGDLTAKAGQGLADDQTFRDFFTYIDTTARPVLTEMGQTLGYVTDGVAELIMAADPLSRDFSTGLRDAAKSFDEWAAGLAQTKGFHDFVDYIQSNGPRVLDTLGAVANALVQLVQAAAPVGPVALAGIRLLADSLAAIADSPVGPILISTAAAVGVLGRSLALLKTVGLRGDGQSMIGRALNVDSIKNAPGVLREASAAARELATAEQAAELASRRLSVSQGVLANVNKARRGVGLPEQWDLASGSVSDDTVKLAKANERVTTAAERAQVAERAKATAIREGAVAAGKGAAAAAGLAVATTGVADQMGLSNTASLALLGTIGGPWGAAVGGAVGLTLDLAHANDDLETSISSLDRTTQASAVSFAAWSASISDTEQNSGDLEAKSAGLLAAAHSIGGAFGELGSIVGDKWGHDVEQGASAASKARVEMMQMGQTTAEVYAQLNHGDLSMVGASFEDLQKVVEQISPALQRAGINVKAFLQSASGSDLRKQGVQAIRDYFNEMDSASGKSKAVADALRGLGSQMTDDATQADRLKTAMDRLFGVQLTQSAATDAWIQSLHDLNTALKGTHDTLVGGSQAALQNRAAIRDSVSALEDKINADAAAHVSGDKLVGTLIQGRNAIIQQATAAGASRKEIRDYLDTLGLTPKNLTTILKADTLSAKQKVEALRAIYGLTPKELRTLVTAAGVDPTAAKIKALAKQYHLTPKEVRTLLSADDKASTKAKAAKKAALSFTSGRYDAKLQALDLATKPIHQAKSVALDFAHNRYAAKVEAMDLATPVTNKAKAHAIDFAHGRYAAGIDAHDDASGVIARVRGELAALNGRTATTRIVTQHITQHQAVTIPGITKPRRTSERGNLFDAGRTVAFASGGFGMDGAYYPREPQIVTGGVNILWGEKPTGWEAYISGKPSERDRNLDILSEAADRLGATVEYASGGITAYASGGVRGSARAKEERKLTGEISKLTDQIKKARGDRVQYKQSVAQAFVSDPFGGTLGGFESQLRYETGRLRGTKADLATLRGKGVDPTLLSGLAASGNANLIGQFAHLSKSQLAAEAQALRVRNTLDRQVGVSAAEGVYRRQITDLTHEVTGLTKELNALRHGKGLGNTYVKRQVIREGATKSSRRKGATRVRHG